MKKLVLIFLLIGMFFVVAPFRVHAFALSTPYVVIGDNVWLLNVESGEKLFLLPTTYYAKIEEMDENYYYVTFNNVKGKVNKNSVAVVGYDKETKGTLLPLKISSEYAVFTEIKLKSKVDGEIDDIVSIPTGETFTYVGTYQQNDVTWYYVTYGGEYGYLQAQYTDVPNITINDFIPENDSETITEPSDIPSQQEQNEPDLVKILVISGVCVVGVILAIILFIPRKNKKHKYYYS